MYIGLDSGDRSLILLSSVKSKEIVKLNYVEKKLKETFFLLLICVSNRENFTQLPEGI
jgi:hypothetical protein